MEKDGFTKGGFCYNNTGKCWNGLQHFFGQTGKLSTKKKPIP
jgi:hypothetical protein